MSFFSACSQSNPGDIERYSRKEYFVNMRTSHEPSSATAKMKISVIIMWRGFRFFPPNHPKIQTRVSLLSCMWYFSVDVSRHVVPSATLFLLLSEAAARQEQTLFRAASQTPAPTNARTCKRRPPATHQPICNTPRNPPAPAPLTSIPLQKPVKLSTQNQNNQGGGLKY